MARVYTIFFFAQDFIQKFFKDYKILNINKVLLKNGGLYVISSPQNSSEKLYETVEKVLDAGAGLLQYRDKSQEKNRRFAEASKLRELCHYYNVPLLINDDVNLAKATCADGVHLGQSDSSLYEARLLLGEEAIIGVSCYDKLALAQAAVAQGADYVAFGRFYRSGTKPDAVPASLSLLREARAVLACPIVAIGGILPEYVPTLQAAGADWWAVIGGIFAAESPALATQAYLQAQR